MKSAAIPDELRAPPAPAKRSHPRFEEYSRREDVHRFCVLVTGRDFPACILDDELLSRIVSYINVYGVDAGALEFKRQLPLRVKALIRAVSRNVAKLKAEGKDLWAR